jgi:hypothetical protein
MPDISSQLANIFKKGLEADPKSAKTLASALSSHVSDMSATDGPHTKAEANYHTATDSKRECGTCDNMIGDHECQIVSGNISADGTCDFYSGQDSQGDGKSQSDQADSPGPVDSSSTSQSDQ